MSKRLSEKRDHLFLASRDAIMIIDPPLWKFTSGNPATLEMFGMEKEEDFLSCDPWILSPELQMDGRSSAEKAKEMIDIAIQEGSSFFEWIHRRRNGEVFLAEVLLSRIQQGDKISVQALVRDVTERKMMELTLTESEGKYRTVIEMASDGIVIIQDDIIRFANPRVATMLGYESGEVVGRTLASFIPQDNLDLVEERYRRRMAGEKLSDVYEMILCHKDGDKISVETSGNVIQYEGKPADLAIIRDITERKKTEKKLKDRERAYSTLVENIPDMIVRFDSNLRYIFCNAAVEHHFGVSADVFIGKTPLEIRLPSLSSLEKGEQNFVNDNLKKVLDTNESLQVEQSYSFPSGTKIFQTRIIPEHDDQGKIKSLLSISSDITDSRFLESERQKTTRIESIGVLAGGIAHDFNNILTAVIGNISLARMDVESDNKKEALISIDMVEKASMKAKGLTQQLLTFSKGGSPIRKVMSLSKIVKDSVDFIMSGSNIKSNFSISSDLWNANIDEGQIGQVMYNLIINAQQAMPKGGEIQIVAENVTIDVRSKRLSSSFLHCANFNDDNYVRISVTDQGEGISSRNMDKIFDPFFTTKKNGSGLGLATSYSIARKHGGYLCAESVMGKGSSFFLYLPALPLETPDAAVVRTFVKSRRDRKILVMDDNEDLRESLSRILRQIGYEDIELTDNGSEAVELYQKYWESKKKIDVVILDLTVPGGMGGEKTIKKLREIDPKVKAIVSSGYVDKDIISNYAQYGFRAVLPKPYTVDDVRECMEKANR